MCEDRQFDLMRRAQHRTQASCSHLVLFHLALHPRHERVQRVRVFVDGPTLATATVIAALELCQQRRLRACRFGGLQACRLFCCGRLEAGLVSQQQVPG